MDDRHQVSHLQFTQPQRRRLRPQSEMPSVRDFDVNYHTLNNYGSFCAGDIVTGAVSFGLDKETNVKSLYVEAKAKAKVAWSSGNGNEKSSYVADRKYFKLKGYLIEQNSKGTVLSKGVHRFAFRLQIPDKDMPSSFKGIHGKIVYLLEAKLLRSWQLPCVVKKEFNFVARPILNLGQQPQVGLVQKEVNVFNTKQVQMAVFVDKRAYTPGQTLVAVAKIKTDSCKKMTPKFTLQQKVVYRARRVSTSSKKTICKLSRDAITGKGETTVWCAIALPQDLPYSIHNCDILSVDYYLKVYLDVFFAFDPTVVFPVIIIPSIFASYLRSEAAAPNAVETAGGSSNSDLPPPAASNRPSGSAVHGPTAPVRAQNPNTASGYDQQLPQQASPHGYSASSGHRVQHTAPSLPQHGEPPPSYMCLFPPSSDGTHSHGNTTNGS